MIAGIVIDATTPIIPRVIKTSARVKAALFPNDNLSQKSLNPIKSLLYIIFSGGGRFSASYS